MTSPNPIKAIHTHDRDYPQDTIPADTVILYCAGSRIPWIAAMNCPCGCGEHIHLSLLENESPHWRYIRHDDDTVSFSPSIQRTKGCMSHFHLLNGRIEWC